MLRADREILPRFMLRNTADINRLFVHLLSHRVLPRVDFQVDGLHVLHSQRAQDRFARLSEACNCMIGETLAVSALLVGVWVAWASSGAWTAILLAGVIALYAGILGKALEVAWTRVRLLRVLLDLNRRLATAEGSPERHYAHTVMAPAVETAIRPSTLRSRVVRAPGSARPRRTPVVLRDLADIDRLFTQLASQWQLPRIEIIIESIPGLEVQRAQTGVTRYSSGCSYFPAAFMAAAVLLGGLLYIVWMDSQTWFRVERADWWLLQRNWDGAVRVVAAAACAALAGTALEWAWNRVRLLLVLRGLRNQLA